MATGVTRAGLDAAGGVILVGNPTVLVNGMPIAVNGNAVTPHGMSPHDAPVMVAVSNLVLAGGISIVRATNLATCGHAASGSINVFSG